jgi:PAS domain S-box-containing protein
MSKARKERPDAERWRLRAIRSVDLEEGRPAFERIARIAQRLAGTPIAHVSMVEAETLWLAGVSDIRMPPVPREHAFATLAIEGDGVIWLPDAAADPRFAANPFVHGGPGFRFYAGAPIRLSNGSRVGALSVIDRAPRAFDPALAAALEDLAALVADEWERRRALKDLAASEAEARAAQQVLLNVVSDAPVALLMMDRRMRVLECSAQWRIDCGFVGVEVAGRSLYDLFPGADEAWRGDFDRGLAGETIHWPRTSVGLPDGRQPWMRVVMTPWRDSRGRVGGLLLMSHDITDMVETLEASKRSEQTLKLAMEIGELSMWELDHRRHQANAAGPIVGRSHGLGDYQRMSTNIWEAVHPADTPAAKAAWDRYETKGEPFRAVFRLLQRNGPHIWVQSAAEAIRDADGQIERLVGVIRNIDEQKRSEMALARAKEAAEAANRAKSEFLANMSHEIRTPLNGVMGVASALSRTELAAGQREMVSLIESSARALESLLCDVLDLARIESGRMVLAHEPFDLRRCLGDVAALFQPIAEAKGLALMVEPADEIDGAFLGDAARVRQILTNLVSNAVKFTPSGEVRIGAAALRTPDGVEARIFVKDTGIGFDEETKARLFDRFEQADGSITRQYGGTGLGLAISRSLAEKMGGSLEAAAEPGKGATFTLRLPLTRAESGPIVELLESGPSLPAELAPVRVLLAEDHPTNRRVVELILAAAAVDLTSVANGQEALDAWRCGDFDLILMDMQMPVMDGLTAIRQIRACEAAAGRPRVQIHALTANAMPEHAEASRAAGADGHLTKPITAESLFRTVEAVALGEVPDRRQRA